MPREGGAREAPHRSIVEGGEDVRGEEVDDEPLQRRRRALKVSRPTCSRRAASGSASREIGSTGKKPVSWRHKFFRCARTVSAGAVSAARRRSAMDGFETEFVVRCDDEIFYRGACAARAIAARSFLAAVARRRSRSRGLVRISRRRVNLKSEGLPIDESGQHVASSSNRLRRLSAGFASRASRCSCATGSRTPAGAARRGAVYYVGRRRGRRRTRFWLPATRGGGHFSMAAVRAVDARRAVQDVRGGVPPRDHRHGRRRRGGGRDRHARVAHARQGRRRVPHHDGGETDAPELLPLPPSRAVRRPRDAAAAARGRGRVCAGARRTRAAWRASPASRRTAPTPGGSRAGAGAAARATSLDARNRDGDRRVGRCPRAARVGAVDRGVGARAARRGAVAVVLAGVAYVVEGKTRAQLGPLVANGAAACSRRSVASARASELRRRAGGSVRR